jgi:lipopolysaccharide transport system permease protein
MHRLATTFGWQDIAQRYRRSPIGAFWLTINMAVLIGALGMIFGMLFRMPLTAFLPYVCAGLVAWGYVSTALNEGCTAFIASDGLILHVRMPLFTHVLRVLWRNAIILSHNLLIFPIVLLAVGRTPTWGMLWAIPGWVLLSLNLAWMMLVLGILCARYRDMIQVVQNLLQVLFYATPLMWMPQALPDGKGLLATLNPFFHLVSVVRDPLLGQPVPATTWGACLSLLALGWLFVVPFFARYRHRVPYWL